MPSRREHRKQQPSRETVYGINAVTSIIGHCPQNILSAWVIKDHDKNRRLLDLASRLESLNVKVQHSTQQALDAKADGGVHQGVVLEIVPIPPRDERDLEDLLEKGGKFLFLILDGVTDPRNLGACMRSALGAGAHGVIVPKDRSALLGPAVRKAASGAAEALPLFAVTNLSRVISCLQEQGIEVVGFDMDAEKTLYDADLSGSVAIAMGSEDQGLRRLTAEKCDYLVKIPISSGLESLNVSAAASVALFEIVRQRIYKN